MNQLRRLWAFLRDLVTGGEECTNAEAHRAGFALATTKVDGVPLCDRCAARRRPCRGVRSRTRCACEARRDGTRSPPPGSLSKVRVLTEVLKPALAHVEELAEAWRTGALDERDGLGGTRSNRNMDVLNGLRRASISTEGGE